jgi:hypothetical protein
LPDNDNRTLNYKSVCIKAVSIEPGWNRASEETIAAGNCADNDTARRFIAIKLSRPAKVHLTVCFYPVID